MKDREERKEENKNTWQINKLGWCHLNWESLLAKGRWEEHVELENKIKLAVINAVSTRLNTKLHLNLQIQENYMNLPFIIVHQMSIQIPKVSTAIYQIRPVVHFSEAKLRE